MILDYSLWQKDGTLAYTSLSGLRPRDIAPTQIGKPFRDLVRRVLPGGRARFWIPKAALEGWRPAQWPNDDVIIDLEMHDAVPPPQRHSVAARPSVAPPDIAGAPKEARRTPSGLRYVVLEPGSGEGPGLDSSIQLDFRPWVARGMTMQPLHPRIRATMTPKTAPGGLGQILSTVKAGSHVRVWVSKERSAAIVPKAKGNDVVVDLVIRRIETG